MVITDNEALYFKFARERYRIYLKREAGEPYPWTDEPILRKYRFTNVHREHDKVTTWFRENVRERLRTKPEVLLATVLFRSFCRIEVGQIIFGQGDMLDGSPWEHYLKTGKTGAMKAAILKVIPRGPWVTGAYMLKSPTGMDKLTGMLSLAADFHKKSNWKQVGEDLLWGNGPLGSLETFTRWLQKFPLQGPFVSYENTCDLRHTDLLCNAPDIDQWANIGPGCRRGLNMLYDRKSRAPVKAPTHIWHGSLKESTGLAELRHLLELSRDPKLWPTAWPKWEMREAEGWCCEMAKIWRGYSRQIFRSTA